jgi:hypothetical protein
MATLPIERADVAGTRFDADRGVKIEELEDGPKAVMAHVGQRAAAEIVPTAKHHVGVVRMIGTVGAGPKPE